MSSTKHSRQEIVFYFFFNQGEHLVDFITGLLSLQKLYKLDWDENKATGYQLNHEYIPLLTAKKARNSVSDVSIPSGFLCTTYQSTNNIIFV